MSLDPNDLEVVRYLIAADPVIFSRTNEPTTDLETRTIQLLALLKLRSLNFAVNGGMERGSTSLASAPANGTEVIEHWKTQNLGNAGDEVQKGSGVTNNSEFALRVKATTSATSRVENTLTDYKNLRGIKITLSADIRFVTTNGGTRVRIEDSAGNSELIVASGTLTTSFQRFTITRTIDAAATSVKFVIGATNGTATAGQIYIDNVWVGVGDYPLGLPYIEQEKIITEVVGAGGAITQEVVTTTGGETSIVFVNTSTPGTNTRQVYRNRAKQILAVDYTETNSTTIAITVVAGVGELFESVVI